MGHTVTLTGTYTPHTTGAPETFTLTVYDGGEPGSINGDSLDIELPTGGYAGYSNAEPIQGGNIHVF